LSCVVNIIELFLFYCIELQEYWAAITHYYCYIQPIEQDDQAGAIWNLATLAVLHSNTQASRSESIVWIFIFLELPEG
jgi:hypothetical protein